MTWKICEASSTDADRLALIGAATFLETFAGVLDGDAIVAHCLREHSSAAYRGYLAEGALAWIGEVGPGRAPVGFALLGRADLPGAAKDGTDLELKRIYALFRFHGGGLGQALLRRAVERARVSGAERLLLGVYAGNTRALAFYKKNGFSKLADRRFQVGEQDYEDVVLAKALR